MQLKPITAIIVLSFVVASLSVAGCSSSQNASPQQSASATATSLYILKVNNIRIPLDNSSNVSAILNTSAGNRLGGKTIQWFVNDQPAGNSTTNQAFGEALLYLKSANLSLALGRNYTVRAEFNGDSAYLQSNDTSRLRTYMYSSDFTSNVYDATFGLMQSGSFPALTSTSSFSGPYLVFDLSSTSSGTWRDNLPYTVYNASSTVFFVKTTKLDLVGQYYSQTTNAPGGQGYRAQFDIYIIKYPEKTPIGKYSITSEPPTIIGYYLLDQIGSPSDWHNWINQHTDASS
jgi:hypothetical protein